jgi:hypothetical protein
MKPVSKEFTHYGRTLRQLERTANVAIYELIGAQRLLYGYEIIRIREQKQREVFGKIREEHEVYPCDSDFGRMGWSYGRNHQKEAFERFSRIVTSEHQSAHASGPSALERAIRKQEEAACY